MGLTEICQSFFLIMNKVKSISKIFLLFTFVISVTLLHAESENSEGYIFSFSSASRLKITERSNIRVTVNGQYQGLTYNESRSVLDYMWHKEGKSQYAGSFLVFQDSIQDTRTISNLIERDEYCEIQIDSAGHYTVEYEQTVPVLRSFPVFSVKPVTPGDKWRDFGERIVDPLNNGRLTAVKFYCEYSYAGIQNTSLGEKHIINAQYAMRYKKGDSYMSDDNLKQISGRHMVTIMIDTRDSSSIFIRDMLDEQYQYTDGTRLEHSGFILTWYNDVVGMDREDVVRNVSELIEERDLQDVEVTEKQEGISISLQDIHFVPDSPEILPEEISRIDRIAEILRDIDPSKIMVVGHTADVGTKASQYELSEKRAETVINILVGNGFPPALFIYKGAGGDEPVGDNGTEEGRAKNRRVEFIILED